MTENGLDQKAMIDIEQTMAAYTYLWCKGNGFDIDSLTTGQVFGIDMRLGKVGDRFIAYPIDLNFGRFVGPAYTYAHVNNLLGEAPNVILQEHKAVTEIDGFNNLTPRTILLLRERGVLISPVFNVLGDKGPVRCVSIIYTGENKEEAEAKEVYLKQVLMHL
jgi:hypothetical protein